MASTRQPPLGAYGFALAGLEGAKSLLSPVSAERPVLEVASTTAAPLPKEGGLTLPLEGGGALHLEREPLRAVFALPRPSPAEALVHPYLVPAAALAGEWHGLHAFHAGAFVAGEGVWGVVGGRGDGKSSFLLSLALRDVEIVTDDLLVSGGEDIFPARGQSTCARTRTATSVSARRWACSAPACAGATGCPRRPAHCRCAAGSCSSGATAAR